MMIKKPKYGPLIGHLTDTSINLWISEDIDDYPIGKKLFAFAIISDFVFTAKLKEYNNMSATIHIEGLAPETHYDIIIGISDYDIDKQDIPDDIELDYLSIMTLPDHTFDDTATIALMSCHYPEPIKKSDKIFKAMKDILDNKEVYHMPILCHVGDQIYADQLNRLIPLKRADTAKEFKRLYENKYSGKYFSQLVKQYPSVMVLDDHEIEDNWTMDRISDTAINSSNARDLFSLAIHAYKTYQLSHSPLYANLDTSHLWYTFNIGVYPFFVLDLRTERNTKNGNLLGNPNPADPEEKQLVQLCNWLIAQEADVPKFIISSSIFAPFTHDDLKNPEKSDNWSGFPKTRKELLQCIADNSIQKVVFLSGDIHNSFATEIVLEPKNQNDNPIKMWQIVSSPLHWIFPFADGDIANYILDTKEDITKGSCLSFRKKSYGFHFKDSNKKKWTMHYTVDKNSYTQQNNFAIIDFNKEEITSKWYGETGDTLCEYHSYF